MPFFLVVLLCFFHWSCQSTSPSPSGTAQRELWLLDMVHHNPGEPLTQSRFTDPTFLAGYGYDAMVTNDFTFIHTAIRYDSLDQEIFPLGSKQRVWVDSVARQVTAHIERCHEAGIEALYFTDIIVLPQALVEKYQAQICTPEGKVDLRKPFTQHIHRLMIREIFARFPALDGLVIRTGETYLHNVPYHTGNNPILDRGDTLDLMATHRLLIDLLREEVCEKLGKKLVYRTWDFGLFHTQPEIYLGITDRIAPHPHLYFSIKHPKGDYHRTFPFNPTLGIGQHPQIVEVQCQREYEGKGAHPNYVMNGVIEGFEEYAAAPAPRSLRDLLKTPQLAGVWSWSRGGGWVGPYLQNELWCDLNAYVIAQWTQQPNRAAQDLLGQYAREKLGLAGQDVARFQRLCLLSAQGVVRGHSSLLTPVNVWWTRDQFLGGLEELSETFDAIIAQALVEPILAEKAQSAAIWDEIVALADQLASSVADPLTADYVRVSARYGRYKYHLIHRGWEIMLRGYWAEQGGPTDRPAIEAAIAHYDALWQAYRQLAAEHAQCATVYRPYAFQYVRPHYQAATGMATSVDRYR